MSVKYNLLEYMREKNDYVSGSELGAYLGISRAAVHKHIDKLKKEGCQIDAVSGRGYKLLKSGDMLDPEEIGRGLSLKHIGSEILCYKTLSSTNDKAKALGEEGKPSGAVITAENQTKGKGRRGKSWSLEPKSGIAMSILLRPAFSPEYASNLTLIAGMAVNRALRRICGVDCLIKWPNDIVSGGKKLCGILVETVTEEKDIRYLVCGIGINVSNSSFPEEIEKTAASIFTETGRKYMRRDIIKAVLEEFDILYDSFLDPANLPNIIGEYKKSCINIDREVTAVYAHKTIKGIATDINSKGELIIKTENAEEIVLRSGEVSVRGVYQ